VSSWEIGHSATRGGRPVARSLAAAQPRARVVTTGTIVAAAAHEQGPCLTYRCRFFDGTGEVELVFLGRRAVAGLAAGTRCTVEGTVMAERGRLVIWNPLYRIEAVEGHTPSS
jgi:RecG-like helicase